MVGCDKEDHNKSFISTLRHLAISAKVSNPGCALLVHHFEIVAGSWVFICLIRKFKEYFGTFIIILDIIRFCPIFIIEENMRGRLIHRSFQNRKTPLQIWKRQESLLQSGVKMYSTLCVEWD